MIHHDWWSVCKHFFFFYIHIHKYEDDANTSFASNLCLHQYVALTYWRVDLILGREVLIKSRTHACPVSHMTLVLLGRVKDILWLRVMDNRETEFIDVPNYKILPSFSFCVDIYDHLYDHLLDLKQFYNNNSQHNSHEINKKNTY